MSLSAQEPIAIHITDKDGFPDNEVYDLLQDKDANIWIASNKGLFKFDGKTFTHFTHPKKQGRSFFNLTLDPYGRLWCNNLAGQFFYIENDELKLFGNYQDIIKGALSDFTFLKNNLVFKVYLGAGKTKTIFVNLNSKKLTSKPISIRGTSTGFVVRDTFYFYTKKFELHFLDQNTNSSVAIDTLTKYSTHSYSKFYPIKNSFWITRRNKLNLDSKVFVYNNAILKEIALPKPLHKFRIENITEKENRYYFSTSNGLYICSFEAHKLVIKEHYLKGIFVTKTLVDINKNLWISTLEKGIYIIPNGQIKRVDLLKDITTLEKKNDTLCLIGTRSGLLLEYNIVTKSLTKNSLSDSYIIRSLSYNKKTQDLLFVSDKKAQIIHPKNISKKINLKGFSGIKSTDIINDSTYVISASYGTLIMNKKGIKKLTSKRGYTSLYSKIYNKLYSCDIDGLQVYNSSFQLEQKISTANGPIYTFDMSESNQGVIWSATYDKGILGIKNDTIITYLNEANGLASNFINAIKTDGNNLWIATEKGLQQYHTITGTFKILTKQDGIDSYAIKHIEVLGNTVLFASNLGLFSFDKTKVFKEHTLQKPYISSVQIQEKDTLVSNNYILPQKSSNIRFNFNIKGFHSNQSLTYQYQLKGIDKEWKTLKRGLDYVHYNSLPDGNFILKYRIVNQSKEIISEGNSVQIHVTLPVYKTIWFWLVLFLISIAIIILFFKRRTELLKKAQKNQLEKAEISRDLIFSQLENLRSQMNPHFIFNALNSIQDYIIINEKKLAREYLVKFAKLIRLYLDQSRKNEISLEDELSTLNLYLELEKERFEDDFNYEVYVDHHLNKNTIYVPSLLIQPYVENALKHGLLHKMNDKKLQISFVKNIDQSSMQCSIADNGIGREASAKINEKRYKNHTSFATSANQKRLSLLNTAMNRNISVKTVDLYDENNKGIGTVVTINLPI